MEDERIEAACGYLPDTPERVAADVSGGSGWVTTKVAAEALGVNPRTVRTYIERGDLKAKSEGEGIQKAYLVSIDSVYALRDRRQVSAGNARRSGADVLGKSASTTDSAGRSGHLPGGSAGVPAEELTSMIRDLTVDLIRRTADAAELRTRLELTAQAESTLQEALEHERKRAEAERERADRLEAELREVRKPPPEPQDISKTASEDVSGGDVSPEQQEPSQRRSWLYRFFFGP